MRRVSADNLRGSKWTSPAKVTRFSPRDELMGAGGGVLFSSSWDQILSLINSSSKVAALDPTVKDSQQFGLKTN